MRRWWWRWAAAAVALLMASGLTGQGAPATLYGEVRTAEGMPVAAVDVLLRQGERLVARTVTDAGGAWRLTRLAPGSYRVSAQYLGYSPARSEITLEPGAIERVDLVLEVEAVDVEDVRVEARRDRTRFREEAGATVVALAGDDVERLPGLAEADVLRAVEVLPGVISTSDFSASFNVRGGAADQNLILLDGIPIYNPFHLGGVFSVFNADMVERTELLAGGFPARYGGRVSSVLDVRSDAGDGDFSVDAGVSLLASRVAVGGGLPDDAARALGLAGMNGRISFRRSYFDVLLSPFFDFPYNLTDVQGVAEAWTENGVWTLSGYTGADVLDLRNTETFPLPLRLDWGNDILGLRWTGRLLGTDVEARASTSAFDTGILFPDFEDTRIGSAIDERRAGLDLAWTLGDAVLGVGGELARIGYDNRFETGGTVFNEGADEGWQGAAYTQLDWETSSWLIEVGARVDVWDPESADAWVDPSPRLALKRFIGDGDAALKLALGRYTQALHSLRDEEVPIGIDVWITAGDRAPLVVSDQVQVGYERLGDEWSGSVEAYLRSFDGIVNTNGAEDPNDPRDDLLVGDGRSWGVDVLLRREPDPDHLVDGWVAISYLNAEQTFPEPFSVDRDEVTYPPIYDRRWDVDLVLRYPLPGGIEGGLRFNFGSGLPYTRPVGAYEVYDYDVVTGRLETETEEDDDEEGPETAVVLGPRNGERYPAYHRLDASFRRPYTTEWGTVTPFLDLLNVYDRRDNVLFYFYDYGTSPATRTGVSMLPVLPTIGVEVSF